MDTPGSVPLDALLRHAGFVRALARSLVRDGHDAEDVEQEVWLAALRRSPADPSTARGWMARVVHNLAGLQARRGRRRRAREQAAARPEALESHTRRIAELESHERLVRALLGLREPYRGAIVLCYFHGLSVRAAAERLGVPPETLKTRLRRGLAHLREELDRAHGREGWMPWLVPCADGEHALPLAAATPKLAGGVLALALALGAAGWWGTRAPGAAPTTRGAASPRAPAAAVAELSSRAPERPERVEPRTPSPPPPAPRSAAPTPAGLLVTVVVLDELEREHAAEDGVLRLRAADPSGSGPYDLEVARGRCVFPSPPSRALEVQELVLGGRAAYPIDARPLEPRGTVTLRARWVPTTVLTVVDRLGGAPLSDVTVLRNRIAWRGQRHPGVWSDGEEWLRGARSPVTLPSVDGQRTYWVGARDHAWRSVEIDHRSGGERRVELERGASLSVVCDGVPADCDVRLRLFALDEPGAVSGALDVPAPDRAGLELEGLAPGAYEARAEIGMWYDAPRVLARARVELVPGAHEHLRLVLDPGELGRAAVPLEGELVLPADCHEARIRLSWQPLGRPPLRRGDRGVLALERMQELGDGRRTWYAAQVTPGEYVLGVDPFQWWQRVQVDGGPGARLVVPPLVRVEVRVTDLESGEPLAAASVSWARPRPAEQRLTALDAVAYDPAVGAFVLYAPEGRLTVHCDADDHEALGRGLDVGRGGATLEVGLRRLPSFTLLLRDGGVLVPLAWGTFVEVEPVGHEGEATRRDAPDASARFVVSEPGAYRVRVPTLEGFAEVPDEIVVLEAGEPRRLVIELRRR